MFKHILLPLDGSELAETAIPITVELCRKLGSHLTLIHIIEKDAPSKVHGQRHLTNEEDALVYLEQIEKKYFGVVKKVTRHVHSEEVDKVATSIVEHSDELKPDLIILCTHGEGGLSDFVTGSIAQQVVTAGKVPVLLVRPPGDTTPTSTSLSPLMIALDGDPEHDKALEIAGGLALQLNSDLYLIRVVPTLSTLTGEQAALGTLMPTATNAYLEIAEDEVCDYLGEKMASWRKRGVICQAEVQRGDPAEEVVKSANLSKTAIIILGTHGKSGLSAFWSGSVAPKIVAKTTIPVLLLPVWRD